MANALTIGRIVLSIVALVPPVLSPTFLVLYVAAGVTDMLDGLVARRTHTQSEMGSKLDSIADLVLAMVCLVKILPVLTVPTWLWIWVILIAVVRVANVASGFVLERRLVMLHTTANKVAGLAVFLIPLTLPFLGLAVSAVPVCAIATFAAVQEGHLIRIGKAGSFERNQC